MKKTLFLSALLGAVLAAPAMAVTYGGTIYTYTPGTNYDLHNASFTETTIVDGEYVLGETDRDWHHFSNSTNSIIRYTSGGSQTSSGIQFDNLTIGGVIVDEDSAITSLVNHGNRSFYIGKNGETSGSSINKSFTIKTETGSITLRGTQEIAIAEGQTLTLGARDGINLNEKVAFSGSGSLKLDTTAVNVNLGDIAKTEGNGFGTIVINHQIATGTVDASTVTTWKVNGTTDESLSYNSATNTLTGVSRTSTNYYINDAASWDGTLTGATTVTVNATDSAIDLGSDAYDLNTLTINKGAEVKTSHSGNKGVVTGDIVINSGKLSVVGGGQDAFGYNGTWGGNYTDSLTLIGEDAEHKAVLNLAYTAAGSATFTTNLNMYGHSEISGTRNLNTFSTKITVKGTDNEIKSGLEIRQNATAEIQNGASLLISGTVSRFAGFDGALTKTGAGTLTITGNITGGSIIGDGANTIIRDNTISGATFQNVTFTNTKVNGTITLNGLTGDGKLQTALSGLTKSDAQGASSTINLGGGEYTFNAETTVNDHHLVFGGNTEINGHGYDSTGHTITLSNGASVNTGANELKIESKATLKVTNGTSVTSGSVILGHNVVTNTNQTKNVGTLTMAGGSITTGFIKSNAGYAASDNTFTMTGGTLTFTKPASETVMVDGPEQDAEGNPIPVEQTNTYNAIDGVTATITGGTLSTANAAWKIDNADVTLGAVTISGANAATLSHVKLSGATKIHTNTTMDGGITSLAHVSNGYAFLVESNSALTFTGADYDLTNADAGIGLQAGSSVVVDSDASLTLKTFVYSSDNQWTTKNGSATVKAGATLNIEGNGFRDAFLSSMELQGALNLATDAKLHLSTLTGSETASLAVNGTMEVVNAGATTVGSLTLGSGAKLTLGSEQSHNIDLTTTNLTVTGDGATLNANLVVAGGTITFADNATLTMGCSVTIGADGLVTVELTDEMVSTIAGGGRVDLFTDVEGAQLVNGNIVFTGVDGATLDKANVYSLQYDATTKTIYAAPEPATATLSLLALAALCARRKRH